MDIWGWIVNRLPDWKLKAEIISYPLRAFLWKLAEYNLILKICRMEEYSSAFF